MWAHWRLMLGAAFAAAAWAASALLGVRGSIQPLVAWNAGSVAYLFLAWRLFVTADEAELRQRADRLDERRGVILAIVLLAIAAALGAIVAALNSVKQAPGTTLTVAALAVATLITSWLVLQSLFTAHYAHRHFQAIARGGPAAGFQFPGEPPRSYLDFVYLAVCIGATAQISDPSVPTTRLRNLVTAHAAISFFYNTAVLAVGINILSSLVGR
ncbi:MAG TPA: DUF1345 domain-containing protein [Caulobacteraceae bacterium]|nr:DUF1345 domain-containing protein [Caulobacteraceae bacterium]